MLRGRMNILYISYSSAFNSTHLCSYYKCLIIRSIRICSWWSHEGEKLLTTGHKIKGIKVIEKRVKYKEKNYDLLQKKVTASAHIVILFISLKHKTNIYIYIVWKWEKLLTLSYIAYLHTLIDDC